MTARLTIFILTALVGLSAAPSALSQQGGALRAWTVYNGFIRQGEERQQLEQLQRQQGESQRLLQQTQEELNRLHRLPALEESPQELSPVGFGGRPANSSFRAGAFDRHAPFFPAPVRRFGFGP